jgi:hypothetical protein
MRFSRRTALALGLLSAGALCFEVTLLRLYAVQQFYHFAFLVISLAVLGTAAGGTALALRTALLAPARLAAAFTASILLAYTFLNLSPFDSYAIAWDRRQIAVLGLYFGSAALPFFFHGWFTGAALAAAGALPGRAYAANLAGAGAGPLLALVITTTIRLEAAVLVSAAAGMASAALLVPARGARLAAWSAVILLSTLAIRPPEVLSLRLSPNKPLAQARLYPQAQVTLVRDGLSARLEIVESAGVHSFPGLSLSFAGTLPSQVGLFIDGDGPLAATSLDPTDPASQELAHAMPSGIAFALRPGARSLILRPGAGLEPGLALASGAASVDVPLDEPLVIEALSGPYNSFTLNFFDDPRLGLLPATSRGALSTGGREYDVIDFALSDPFRPAASGAFSLSESYDLTSEAMAAAFSHLGSEGVLVMTRWLTTPPAESLRAWSTLLEGMRAADIDDPQDRLAAFRGIRTSTVLAAVRPWTANELDEIRRFLGDNGFDPIYLPGLQAEEMNRFNRIPDDPYPDLFQRLLDDPQPLWREYPFRIDPPTDDRPFFFHFFRWRQTPEVLAAFGRTWQPFGGSGYLVLLALLILMILLAAILVVIPAVSRSVGEKLPTRGWWYFACVGVGFVLIEVSLLARFALPLERPSLAFAVVVSTLLLSSGAGSLLSNRIPVRQELIALGLFVVGLSVALPYLIRPALAWDYALRVVWAVLLLAPVGLLMGIPFPAGLRQFASGTPSQVGTAWAVNGALSGVAGVAGALLMLDVGLSAVMAIGGLAYLAAWLALRKQISRAS